MIIRYILLGLSLAAPIGPVNVEMIKTGLRTGFSPAIFIGLGAMTADITYLLLTYFGLSRLLVFPVTRLIVGVFGVAVLMYLGAVSIKESFAKLSIQASDKGKKHAYSKGFFIAISSPMTIVWWVGVFGSMVASSTKTVSLLSCFAIMIGAALWVFSICALLHFGKRMVNEKSLRAASFLAGCALIWFAAYCGWTLLMK